MALGPLEYVVIGFEGNHFTREILPKVHEIQDKGVIRLIDLVFVKKGAGGKLEVHEINELNGKEARDYKFLMGGIKGLLTMEDVEIATSEMPEESSAAVALFEHTWAKDLRETIRRANGRLLKGGLVMPEIVEQIEKEMFVEKVSR